MCRALSGRVPQTGMEANAVHGTSSGPHAHGPGLLQGHRTGIARELQEGGRGPPRTEGLPPATTPKALPKKRCRRRTRSHANSPESTTVAGQCGPHCYRRQRRGRAGPGNTPGPEPPGPAAQQARRPNPRHTMGANSRREPERGGEHPRRQAGAPTAARRQAGPAPGRRASAGRFRPHGRGRHSSPSSSSASLQLCPPARPHLRPRATTVPGCGLAH